MSIETYRIRHIAELYGVSLRTLRYYEQRGILRPKRIDNNRFYTAKDRVRLELILKGKRLGFSLAEVERMIGVHSEHDRDEMILSRERIEAQLQTLLRQKEQIEASIAELRQALQRATAK